jgi:hypothetical protein
MKIFKIVLLTTMLTAGGLLAAVDGTVTNQTTGKPQAGATVTLIKLGAGMETVASATSDASGKFSIAQELQAGTPYLVQTLYEGVTYNKAIPPGSPATALNVDVFDASPKKGDAKVTQHMVLLEPSGTDLAVNESIVYSNTGKTTYNDPAGTFRFYLSPGANGQVKVQVTGPQGMPIAREAVKTKEPNVYAVSYPVKPGETRFDLGYAVPSASPGTFESKLLHGGGPVRIVVPKGVKLEGDNIKDLGPEPRTQASIYDVTGNQYKVQFTGTGSLRAAAEAAQPGAEDTGPGIEESKPRIYDRIYPVVGLAAFILLLGFILLYRMVPETKKRT